MYKLRVKFEKKGPIKFLGHLDLMRYFQKAVRRAGLDVRYSEGYSPHQIMNFAQPLGVGITSEGEYLDITLNSMDSTEDVKETLNGIMHEGVRILKVLQLPDDAGKAMTLVAAASYTVTFRPGKEPAVDFASLISSFLVLSRIPVTKKTKKGEKEMDLRPLIYDLFADENRAIHMLVSAGSKDNVKPELLMRALLQTGGIAPAPYAMVIHRNETYLSGQDERGTYLLPMIAEEGVRRIYI